jgi:FkbM family methyltransferase
MIEKILAKIARIKKLFDIYGSRTWGLLAAPVLGREIWIPINGKKAYLNYDGSTFYHLEHSIEKVKKLVEAIPPDLEGDIIDGGANHGLFSVLAAQKFPQKRIAAVEPYDKILPFLKRNVAGKNVTIVEKALSDKDGEIVFYTAPSSDQVGSIIEENVKEFIAKNANIQETRLQAISLKTLVKQEKIEKIAVIKLDIQGAEYSIIKDADEILAMTDCLILEVILIEKTALELLEKARKFFPYHKIINQVPYGADIIFSKKPLV